MADPLSVAASIAGLLSAAASVSKVLGPYISAARDTPQIAHHVNAEVQAASIILSALQSLAQNMASVSPQRAALVQVDQVVTVLTDGVFVFSDLESSVGTLPLPDSSSITRLALRSRFQWVRKEAEFTTLLTRLQSFKSSISLILSILQSDTSLRAEQSQAELADSVAHLLENSQDLSRRLMNLEDTFDAQTIVTRRRSISGSIASASDSDRRRLLSPDTASTSAASTASSPVPLVSSFEFEVDLKSSGPYRRAQRDTMDFSFRSSVARSHAWSVFSGLSLGDVSIMSVIALPVYADEITNSRHYQFGGQRSSVLAFAEASAGTHDNDSLLRKCLKIQLQLHQLAELDKLQSPDLSKLRFPLIPDPVAHPFLTMQGHFQKGLPLLALCRHFNEELHWVPRNYRGWAGKIAQGAAYLALEAVSESTLFEPEDIPTVGQVTSHELTGFLKVLSVIEKILSLDPQLILSAGTNAVTEVIQASSGESQVSLESVLLDDFTGELWKLIEPLAGLNVNKLAVDLGLVNTPDWPLIFAPILNILDTEVRFLLEAETNLLLPPTRRRWGPAFQIWGVKIAPHGIAIGSRPRNSKLLRSRADGMDLTRTKAIAKALDLISLPSRLVETKSEFLSVRIRYLY